MIDNITPVISTLISIKQLFTSIKQLFNKRPEPLLNLILKTHENDDVFYFLEIKNTTGSNLFDVFWEIDEENSCNGIKNIISEQNKNWKISPFIESIKGKFNNLAPNDKDSMIVMPQAYFTHPLIEFCINNQIDCDFLNNKIAFKIKYKFKQKGRDKIINDDFIPYYAKF